MSVIDSGKEACVIFNDVRNVIDSVPHALLLQKLANIGLNPFILRWIENYLIDRAQFVVVSGKH